MINNININIIKKMEIEELENFGQLNNEDLITSIYQYGYETPSKIQRVGIPQFMKNSNCIIQSNSGTGKTACFVIGSLYNIDRNLKSLQVVIITNTRELAEQIYDVSKNISLYLNISIGLYRGGINISNYERYNPNNSDQYKDQMIICTPGRLLDVLKKKIISLDKLKYLILDECDELLNKGFVDNIREISNYLNTESKVALFSATMNNEIINLSNSLMIGDIYKYLVNNEDVTVREIKQYFMNVENEKYKLDNLIDIYKNISVAQSIIFCNRKETAEWLSNNLKEQNFNVAYIHGEMELQKRIEILKLFRNGQLKLLIATDLIARGIDVQQLQLVINYDIPVKKENYIHRIGRSGRFGKKGFIINLVSNETYIKLLEIIQFYGAEIENLPSLNLNFFD